MQKPRIRLKSGAEFDAFSKARKYLCYLSRSGVVKKIKRKYNKRLRRIMKRGIRDVHDTDAG